MYPPLDLDGLWESVPPASRRFEPATIARHPEAVQRYLLHAIAPGTPLASAVRLSMHGAIKLKRWRPFRAEQVIVAGRGMIWRARVKTRGLTIRGFDRFIDGTGAMQWKLGGLLTVMRASGADVSRSAAGRFAAESVWLPSMLCGDDVSWRVDEQGLAHARIAIDRYATDVALAMHCGFVQSIAVARWGNPDGKSFREIDFGAFVEQEATFGGYTIPARLRAGWYIGSDRFESDGRFFHVTIDDAVFR